MLVVVGEGCGCERVVVGELGWEGVWWQCGSLVELGWEGVGWQCWCLVELGGVGIVF